MLRATTNGVLKGYRYNLGYSRYTMDKARETVLTGRTFNTYAEDPAAAAHCYQLRRSFQRVDSQLALGKSVCHKYDVAWATMETVISDVDNRLDDSAYAEVLRALNDPTGPGRSALGDSLNALADSIVQTMNARYGDNYVFAGADALHVPFSWDKDHNLLYRGVSVDAPVPPPEVEMGADGKPEKKEENGVFVYTKVSGGTITEKEYQDGAALQYMLNSEKKYADLGLGLEENEGGKIIDGSAVNVALQGIDFLGCGKDEDDDPKNVVSIIRKMGNILNRCDPESGAFKSEKDRADLQRLAGKFELAADHLSNRHTELDTRKKFLDENQKLLENNAYTIQQQFLAVEDVDPAEAITDFSWAKYCYDSALKVGNSVLSQSLMDYINL